MKNHYLLLVGIFFFLFSPLYGQKKDAQTISPLLASRVDTLGVVYLDDETPSLKESEYIPEIRMIKSFKKTESGYIITEQPYRTSSGYQVDFSSSVAFSQVGNLPAFSRSYGNNSSLTGYFRTGVSYKNAVNAKMAIPSGSILNLALGRNKTETPIPGSYQEACNGAFRLEKIKTGNFRTDIGVAAKSVDDRLMNSGASHARLLHAVYTLPANDALFYPLRSLPDKDRTQELLSYIKTKYEKDKFQADASLSFDKQWYNRKTGTVYPAQQTTLSRNEQLSDLVFGVNSMYKLKNNDWDDYNFKLLAGYSFTRTDEKVNRKPGGNYNGYRNAQDIKYGVTLNHNDHFFELRNKHYFSNTVQNYTNLFPEAGAVISLNRFFDNLEWYFMNHSRIFGSASRSLGEAPLVYRNLAALTTGMNPETALNFYYEDREIVAATKKMTPETYFKTEIGFRTLLFRDRLSLEFSYFNNTTHDMIAPVNQAGTFALDNIGRVRNYGYLLNSELYLFNYRHDLKTWINFNFSRVNSKATAVSGGRERVALAGFSGTGTYFVKDEPLGVIYGPKMKKIGDPAPDFILGLAPHAKWKNWDFSFTCEYSQGGDRWNGTQAYLDGGSHPAEYYIEDASYLRLSQVSLNYRIPALKFSKNILKSIFIGANAQNLFLITPYKGVDPASTLFGYSTGKGLDFFNMPSIRNYQFSIKLVF
jgi:hypothetical protein